MPVSRLPAFDPLTGHQVAWLGRTSMRSMRVLIVALLILAAAAPVACSDASKDTASSAARGAAPSAAPNATSTTLAPTAALGVELPPSQIPWNEVGSGWILSTWSPAPGLGPGQGPPAGQSAVAPTTLFLVDPAGGRYAITTFPLVPPAGPGDLGHTPVLVDWSGDGRRALFEDYGADPNGPGRTTMTEVDLATGAKHGFTGARRSPRAPIPGRPVRPSSCRPFLAHNKVGDGRWNEST